MTRILLFVALASAAAFAAVACTREVVVLDSLSDDYCPQDSSPEGTLDCDGGRCPATPSCNIDYDDH